MSAGWGQRSGLWVRVLAWALGPASARGWREPSRQDTLLGPIRPRRGGSGVQGTVLWGAHPGAGGFILVPLEGCCRLEVADVVPGCLYGFEIKLPGVAQAHCTP